ncbi:MULTISPECIES: glutamyl-tRNA reductase [Clostridium]|uniref:Glutamyl-tRNA reductase n=1 Tax=Clostridium ragsdalei P11 TaxID=1353534 RepID=A0A1A6AIB3_9CLOT|nr:MULTISPECIES: glutamyl-tRNA reductase [Clostridium]OBR89807.1 glutamyl-tRNA reductase [Clostridium ragsdalei P11]QXE19683.1 glutamyl-tRNA reductase [Clostridium sp. 001]
MIQLIGVKSECDIEIRQKFSIVSSKLEDKLKNVYKITGNVLILSTCNRTEIYVDSNTQGEELINAVFDALGWSRELIIYTFYAKSEDAIKHLMEVSCGFHSKILGEDQILGQIKTAYNMALKVKTIKGQLQRLFQNAITCGKKFKNDCEMYKIPVSVPSIAVKEAEKSKIKRYMVIGFGEIGKLVLKYLAGLNTEIVYIVVRDLNKVKDLYENCNWIKFITFKERKAYYSNVDCIISCTSAPHAIIYKEELPKKKFLIFDLAVPKDIDAGVLSLPGVKVYDIDNISSIDENNKIMRKEKMEKYRYIIQEYIDEFIKWQSLDELSPEIQKMKSFGSEICEKRIETFKNKRYTKDNEVLVQTMIQSTAKVYINRAIDVLKEAKLQGKEDEYLKLINKIFC